MLDTPLVSVVIPTYNHADFLRKCLKSVVDQTFSTWEVIVINNFSKDNTIEIVKSFDDPRIHLLNFKNNGIIAASRNEGIRHAKGKFIAFLDSDDWWYPPKLEIAVKHLERSDIVYHDLDIYTNKGKTLLRRIRGRQVKEPVFVDLMKNGTVITNSSVVINKNIINEAGGLSEDKKLIAAEDFDLWLKISRVTEKFCYIPQVLGAYWMGGSNTTEISEKQISRIKALYDKHLPYLNTNDRKQAEMLLSYSVGRIKQQIGLGKEAIALLKTSSKSSNLLLKLKSIYCIILNRIISKSL